MGGLLSADPLILLAAIGGFSAVALLVIFLGIPIANRRKVLETLGSLSMYDEHSSLRDLQLLDSVFDRFYQRYFMRAAKWLYRRTPYGVWGNYEKKLITAGNPWELNADKYMALKVFIIAILGVIATIGLALGLFPARSLLFVVITVIAIGYFIPDLFLSSAVSTRQKKIRLALPDMLDLLTISVEAGLGFDASVSKLVQSTSGPLPDEFVKVLQEMRIGTKRSDALKNLIARVEVPELRSFVLAMVQAEVFGTSIGEVLRAQSKDLRLRRRQKAEEIAQKAPVKMVFPLIICILPSLFMVILGPAVINIYHSIILGVMGS